MVYSHGYPVPYPPSEVPWLHSFCKFFGRDVMFTVMHTHALSGTDVPKDLHNFVK